MQQNNNNAPLIGGGHNNNATSSSTASWFVGAPLSKLCMVATVVFYLLFQHKSAQDAMAMDSVKILRASSGSATTSSSSEWHRYWSSKLTFGSTGELVMGGMLLAILSKQFEREMGTRKFGLFLLVANAGVMFLELFVVVGLTTLMETGGYHYQGPYAVLGALMYLYHTFTPRLHPRFFGILGFTFSEKSFYYAWFAQVVGYQGWNTTLVAALGGIMAYVHIATHLDQTLDIPDAIAKPLTSIGAHLSEPPPRVLAAARPSRGGGGGGGAERLMRHNNHVGAAAAAAAVAAQRPAAPPPPPDPGAIEQLTAMGFERQRVLDALRATNNNVERAADRLLTG